MTKQFWIRAILTLLVSAVSFSFFSEALANVEKYNDNIDELELAQEVEDQDLFDETAMVKEEKVLTKELNKEARSLESRVKNANRKRSNAENSRERLKIKRLDAQKKRDQVYSKTVAAEREQAREEKKVQDLKEQIARLEAQAQESKEKHEKAKDEVHDLKNEQISLLKQKKEALNEIAYNKAQAKKLAAQKRQKLIANKKLARQVTTLQRKAKVKVN